MESFSNLAVVLESKDKYEAVEGLNRRPLIGKGEFKSHQTGVPECIEEYEQFIRGTGKNK